MTAMQDDRRLPEDATDSAGLGSTDSSGGDSESSTDKGRQAASTKQIRERAGEALERATAALGTDEER